MHRMIPMCLLGLGSFVLVSSYARSQTQMHVAIDGDSFATQSRNIHDIEIDFCDMPGLKSIAYTVKQSQKQPICLQLHNYSDNPAMVDIKFVDGTVTNDERENKACGLDTDTQFFGDFVSGYNQYIQLPPQTTLSHYAQVLYPKDAQAQPGDTISGCLVYSLRDDLDDANNDVGFGILVRRAKFITIHIEKAPNYRYFLFTIALVAILLVGGFMRKTNKGK